MSERTALLKQLVRDCQADLARWIVPDSGISDREVINVLLERLDGPQARAALGSDSAEEGSMSDQTAAGLHLDMGEQHPFDAPDDEDLSPPDAIDWAHSAARGILSDLSDRRGIKRGLDDIDEEIRVEIVETMSAIIREAARRAGVMP